jgi:hypothetical protein
VIPDTLYLPGHVAAVISTRMARRARAVRGLAPVTAACVTVWASVSLSLLWGVASTQPRAEVHHDALHRDPIGPGSMRQNAPTPTRVVRGAESGGGACSTLADCNYGGDCVDGGCQCDLVWTGEHCGALALTAIPATHRPASRSTPPATHAHFNPSRVAAAASTSPSTSTTAVRPGIYPPGAEAGVQTTWTWGATGVHDPTDDRYHFFVTQWRNHCPMTYSSFLTQTHVVHVTAATPAGPYVEESEAIPGAAGNPVYARAPDGTHLLYFTNYRYDGDVPNCTGGAHPPPAPLPTAAVEGIHLASSRSLNGPWNIT